MQGLLQKKKSNGFGKLLGDWNTRFFVFNGVVLAYYQGFWIVFNGKEV